MISALKLCTDINIPVISESCTTITLIANTYTTSKKEKYKQTIVCLILLFLSLLNYCKKKNAQKCKYICQKNPIEIDTEL